MPVALASLVAEAKSLIDESLQDYITTADWQRYVDSAIDELWRLFQGNNPDAVTTSAAFTSSPFTIPANRGLRFVQKDPGTNQFRNLQPVSIGSAQHQDGYYRIGDALHLTPGQAGNFALFYVRTPQSYASAATNLDAILEPFREFIEVRAALKGASKRDIAKPELRDRVAQLYEEIRDAITCEQGLPDQIVDVYAYDYRSRGWLP